MPAPPSTAAHPESGPAGRAAGSAERCRPRLLVTTCTPPKEGVYLLDTATGAVQRVHHRPTRGITRGPDGYYFVEHRGGIFHLDLESGVVTPRLDTGQTGCHDLRWIRGEFYLVASYGNRVTRYDAGLRRIDELQLVPDEGDVCHPNCLIDRNGELLLSIFTLSPGRREEKNNSEAWRTEGKILRLDWPARRFEVLYEPLSQPHSLLPCGDRILCCESHHSTLVEVDLDARRKRTVKRLHGFVRGLAIGPDALYVGISREKRKTRRSWWERLQERFQLPCGLLELDPETFRVRARYPIPGAEVYDLLILDE